MARSLPRTPSAHTSALVALVLAVTGSGTAVVRPHEPAALAA